MDNKNIAPCTILSKLFVDVKKQTPKWYIEWEGKRFVRHCNTGDKYYWTSKGRAFRALCEIIHEMKDCPFRVIIESPRGYQCESWKATYENIEWYVNKLEEEGIIQFKVLNT